MNYCFAKKLIPLNVKFNYYRGNKTSGNLFMLAFQSRMVIRCANTFYYFCKQLFECWFHILHAISQSREAREQKCIILQKAAAVLWLIKKRMKYGRGVA